MNKGIFFASIATLLLSVSAFADATNVDLVSAGSVANQQDRGEQTLFEQSPSLNSAVDASATDELHGTQDQNPKYDADCSPAKIEQESEKVASNPKEGWGWWAVVAILFSGFAGSFFSFFATKRMSSHNSRLVGHALVHAFCAECEQGCKIIDAVQNNELDKLDMEVRLPSLVWETFKDKLSEGVLVELLRLARKAGKSSLGFPPEEFLLHMGRYFSYVVPNVNGILKKPQADLGTLPQAAHGVLSMLKTLENQLNSKECRS